MILQVKKSASRSKIEEQRIALLAQVQQMYGSQYTSTDVTYTLQQYSRQWGKIKALIVLDEEAINSKTGEIYTAHNIYGVADASKVEEFKKQRLIGEVHEIAFVPLGKASRDLAEGTYESDSIIWREWLNQNDDLSILAEEVKNA